MPNSAIIRIFLRYILTPVIAWFASPETAKEIVEIITSDEDLMILLGLVVPAIIAAIEGWFIYDKKKKN